LADEKQGLDDYEKTGLLALSCRSLEEYFGLLGKDVRKEEITKEFALDETKPMGLGNLFGEFTFCFLGDYDIKNWNSPVYLGTIDETEKYLLKELGKKIPDKGNNLSDEDRAFKYIKDNLRHVEAAKEGDLRKEASCKKLESFFGQIAQFAEKRAGW
jgi:hypothetical protein